MQELLEYATEVEAKHIRAVEEYGSAQSAAKALGLNRKTVDKSLKRAKKRAAKKGYSPEHDMTRPVPDGFKLRGTSTLYDQDGNQRLQWVKSQIDNERQAELMREAVAAMREEIEPEKPIAPPEHTNQDLLSLYILTDYHLGMYAWGEETGADWDANIAETLLVNWFGSAISQTPQSKQAVLAQLGDFLHFDGLEALTPTSGNLLDADTRFQLMVRISIRVIRRIISMLLANHEHVHIIMAEGNHDIAGSAWLREWFKVLYENEPRVTVDTNADPYYAYKWGKTLLCFHHGHKSKFQQLGEVFVSKFREWFGLTRHAYGHSGHNHHRRVAESSLMQWEQHRTLAAPDAHASRSGYLAGRDATVINYHKEHGEVGRVVINASMVDRP